VRLHFDLAGHVLIRTNDAELSTTAPPHDDFMVLTPDSDPGKANATYYDNEAHIGGAAARHRPAFGLFPEPYIGSVSKFELW